ncbi:ribonuclease H family protein [Angustibacter luteus]|uniref:ribonuclease H n=1 Tax=Angustibacter luteus TaxID=658456 RepID=A0ABW1JEM1_9ACTN
MPEQFSLFDLEPTVEAPLEPAPQPIQQREPATDVQQYEVAVDGSAVGSNPGFAGWGWYLGPDCWAAGSPEGGVDTNNRMELMALLRFLRATAHRPDDRVTIFLDSQYALQCTTTWCRGWARNGWKTKDRQDVKNVDLIKPVVELLATRSATELVWTKAHVGHVLNEGADTAARGAAEATKVGSPVPTGPGWTRD